MPEGLVRRNAGSNECGQFRAVILGEQREVGERVAEISRRRVNAANMSVVAQQAVANQLLNVMCCRLWHAVAAQPDNYPTRANDAPRFEKHRLTTGAFKEQVISSVFDVARV